MTGPFSCPAQRIPGRWNWGPMIGQNGFIWPHSAGGWCASADCGFRKGVRADRLLEPTRITLFADRDPWYPGYYGTWGMAGGYLYNWNPFWWPTPRHAGKDYVEHFSTVNGSIPGGSYGGINVCYADGHVRYHDYRRYIPDIHQTLYYRVESSGK
ncbi:MAG: hypothetical protein BWZ02_02478 [Lentisphaerae bacterium ADurb.BinA184]|nr:MAG: hypothetical protein BWZ02_02478 [Lentisphaerae bacterium ADurb.BinA184]